jgi:hypothetical protein
MQEQQQQIETLQTQVAALIELNRALLEKTKTRDSKTLGNLP